MRAKKQLQAYVCTRAWMLINTGTGKLLLRSVSSKRSQVWEPFEPLVRRSLYRRGWRVRPVHIEEKSS